MNTYEVFDWPPLESNPDVFTDFLENIGVPNDWVVYQCFGLDDDCLQFVPQPVVAVIATFERLVQLEEKERGDPQVETNYFMKQTYKLDYACGVIACIHSIFNNMKEL